MRKRILVVGRGHLGTYLARAWDLPEELHWKEDMDGLDRRTLERLAPDAVVNCAGKTDLSWCEAHPLECFRCNVSAPLGLYRRVGQLPGNRTPVFHLSSGCVWDGPYHADGRPFEPSDPPTPACFYTWTKAACDALLLQEAGAPLLILRPRQLYSPEPVERNTLMKLRRYPRLVDTPNSMTSADTVRKTIEKAMEEDFGWGRIVNVYDPGTVTPFQVGTLLAEAGCREPPERIAKAELDGWHKPRRVDTVLRDPYFESHVQPPPVEEELRRVIGILARRLTPGPPPGGRAVPGRPVQS